MTTSTPIYSAHMTQLLDSTNELEALDRISYRMIRSKLELKEIIYNEIKNLEPYYDSLNVDEKLIFDKWKPSRKHILIKITKIKKLLKLFDSDNLVVQRSALSKIHKTMKGIKPLLKFLNNEDKLIIETFELKKAIFAKGFFERKNGVKP